MRSRPARPPPAAALPLTENPRETMAWMLPYWQERIVRALVQHPEHCYLL
jgi:bisphosphoglycerate-dependent phosphoglycerate mutase